MFDYFSASVGYCINLFQEKEPQNKEWKEQADLLKQEQDREKEEKLKCVQELQTSEERFQKLRDGKKNRQLKAGKCNMEY